MLRKKWILPVFFAVIWMLIKLATIHYGFENHIKIGVFANLLFILLVALGALHQKVVYEKKWYNYAHNFKYCFRNTGIYLILVTLFMFINFKYVNPQILQDRKTESIATELAKDYKTIQANNPALEHVTEEEYHEKVKQAAESISSVSINVSFNFLGIFIICLFYSLLVPGFYKKIMLRI